MRRGVITLSLICGLLAACQSSSSDEDKVSQFWRPISEPNIIMEPVTLQQKLDFDLGQCHCGIYPANATRDEMIALQTDKQRLAETSVTVMPDENGKCLQTPSLVVSECMRQRGWEATNCSGRVPVPGGGSLCATYVESNDKF
jgi:hypothetical protein